MSGVVVKFDAAAIRPPIEVIAPENVIFCPCDFRCDFEELVFSDEQGIGVTNDFTDFLFKKITSNDTIVIELIKNNVVVATLNDDTLGTYYNGFPNQPLYVGFVIDWTKVFLAHSGGRYQVRVTSTILGQENVFTSRYFRLNTFDILSADNTVKIEAVQNGRFENGEFDFTDLIDGGWRTYIRLKGEFGAPKYNLERDIFEDPSYRQIQNRDKVIREFLMKTYIVPESILDKIATQDMLANRLFITAYDVLQEKRYERFPVAPESISDPLYDDYGRTFFEITFSDRQQNIIKTNV